MPNAFAYIVVFGFPLMAIWLFRRNPVPAALIWTSSLAFLFLPGAVNIDLPMLPQLDKGTVASVSALLLCVTALSQRKRLQSQGRLTGAEFTDAGSWLPQSTILRVLLFLHLLGPILTVLSNSDAVFGGGGRFLPGLRSYDALSVGLSGIMSVIPFLLARRFLGNTEAQVKILKILIVLMAAYAVLALVEIRLSPQLNRWVYGYFPHSFVQHIRAGGFRPLVFLPHGLVLGILMAMALLAALGLWRAKGRMAPGYLVFVIPFLAVTLVLSKTLGALVIAVIFAPMILLFGVRLQLLAAAIMASVILAYPMLRGADLVPTDRILEYARTVNPERAHSLDIRFGNERTLLEHANARPILGWGGWGRSRVYSEWTGEDITITDGLWTITVGVGGWVGYLTRFGLLALPLILLAWRRRTLGLTMVTSVLCLVHAANLLDLIPNSGLTPITWLITGALWGRYELGREEVPSVADPDEEAEEEASPYRRQLGPMKDRLGSKSPPPRRGGTRLPNGLITRGGGGHG